MKPEDLPICFGKSWITYCNLDCKAKKRCFEYKEETKQIMARAREFLEKLEVTDI